MYACCGIRSRASAGSDELAFDTALCSFRNARTAGTFLLALEAAWNISGRSMRMTPRPLAFVINPLVRPLRVCMGYVRWTCWAALCYLIARTVQHRCAALRPRVGGAAAVTPRSQQAPASFATPSAAEQLTPRRAPAAAAAAEPWSVRNGAALTPVASATAGAVGHQSPVSWAGTPARSAGPADVAAPGGSTLSERPPAMDASADCAPCGHGYAESCPHGCDVFGGTGQQDENAASVTEAGWGQASQGDGSGIAGYMMQQGLQFADAARAWASRSRNFVRV